MKKLFPILLAAILLIVVVTCSKNHPKYPKTKRVDVVDTYFGVKVHDPYRWLENDSLSDVAEWVKEENNTTNEYLSKIPFRNKIKERLTELYNYTKKSAPFKEGGK